MCLDELEFFSREWFPPSKDRDSSNNRKGV